MKLTITHLKAPWPEGAKVGDVIDLPSVPVWALGKCTPADDSAEVTIGDGPRVDQTGEAMTPTDGDALIGYGAGEALMPVEVEPVATKTKAATKTKG